jgi:hypothetical protein
MASHLKLKTVLRVTPSLWAISVVLPLNWPWSALQNEPSDSKLATDARHDSYDPDVPP